MSQVVWVIWSGLLLIWCPRLFGSSLHSEQNLNTGSQQDLEIAHNQYTGPLFVAFIVQGNSVSSLYCSQKLDLSSSWSLLCGIWAYSSHVQDYM